MNFPDCSNGKLDSCDHKAHMAYSVAGRCPAGHPLAVPEISIVLRYPARVRRGRSSPPAASYSGHADFINGWNQRALWQASSTTA